MKVPFLDLQAQNSALRDEILTSWSYLLGQARFIGGEPVESFEAEFAAACEAPHCVSVSSGTDALRFIFIALGLKPGDEVITAPNTFIATVEAILQAGGRPVFVDVDPVTSNIDPSLVEAAITKKTVGIVPIHLYGQCADMDAINHTASSRGLWVVEDACQAHLAEYKRRKAGTLARAAAFSFYPGKNLGACGEAGAVVTKDPEVASMVRMIRDHGQERKYYHKVDGYNGRCDSIQAAALSIKLKHLPQWNESRRQRAARYINNLSDVDGITLPVSLDGNLHVYHHFIIHLRERNRLADGLRERGVDTGLHYPVPIHLQEACSWMGLKKGSFPVAEKLAGELLSLPIYPELTDEQVDYVCDSIREIGP